MVAVDAVDFGDIYFLCFNVKIDLVLELSEEMFWEEA